jgi:hypothetical protein
MFDQPQPPLLRARRAFTAALSLPVARPREVTTPKHIVLLGDSIFANGAYAATAPM